ncbi:MAG: carboxylating nicotinate-nucleotide diphosphorylase [Pseudomonadota bacterium]
MNTNIHKNKIPRHTIIQQVQNALDEDIGHGDITAALINADKTATAQLIVRESALLCGMDWFEQAFLLLDKSTYFNWQQTDGETLVANQLVCEITGKAAAMLTAERTALNFLQTLSATATITAHYAGYLSDSNIRLLDTRKTLPGLRSAQKYAVTCGGGYNHRHGLFDGVLIKENHIMAAGGIKQAIQQAKKITTHGLKIEIEVETLDEVQQALDAQADILLLDNMPLSMLQQAVEINRNRATHTALLEVSGNINEQKLTQLNNIGIDFVSVGGLTKDVKAIDFSLRF